MMKVKALPIKLRCESLSAHDDPTRNSGGQSWEQGAIRHQLQMTLALKGSCQGETEPKKVTYVEADATPESLTLSEISIPLHHSYSSSKSKGFWQSKWLHLKEQNHHRGGTNKNGSEVCEKSNSR